MKNISEYYVYISRSIENVPPDSIIVLIAVGVSVIAVIMLYNKQPPNLNGL